MFSIAPLSICWVWSVIILCHYYDLESWAWGTSWGSSDNTLTWRGCREHQYLTANYTTCNSSYLETPASRERRAETYWELHPAVLRVCKLISNTKTYSHTHSYSRHVVKYTGFAYIYIYIHMAIHVYMHVCVGIFTWINHARN